MDFWMIQGKSHAFPAVSSVYCLVISFSLIYYLWILDPCLFKSFPLFSFSHFCLFSNICCSLLPTCSVSFIQNQTEKPLKMEKRDRSFIWYYFHFSDVFLTFILIITSLISVSYLACIPLMCAWSLLFKWLIFRPNERALGICPRTPKKCHTEGLESQSPLFAQARCSVESRSKIIPRSLLQM